MSKTLQLTAADFDPLGPQTRWLRRSLFFIYTALLIYGLFRPAGPSALHLFITSDKVMHFLGFAGLAFCTRLAFTHASAWKIWSLIILCAPLSEGLQHQVESSRQFSWLDICANLAGVAAGALCWWITTRLYHHYKTRQPL
ncbi:MAG: hypothetical protein PHF42_09310 [Pseudomonas sp.]|jgi:hypothetical protein|nr:hypothetical protein [Pseudomonas sp.]